MHILFALNDFAYSYAIVTSLLVWAYQKTNKTAAWKIFINNCAIFNEESGEMSFGVLAGANVGDTKTADFNHMNTLYSNLRVYMSASQGMRLSSGNSEFVDPKHGRNYIKPGSEEVQTVGAYVNSIIRKLMRQRHRMYDGEKEGYQNSTKAEDHQMELEGVKHFLQPHFNGLFSRRARKVETKMNERWLLKDREYQTVWPELILAAEEDEYGFSSEELEEEFGDGEAQADAAPHRDIQNADISIEKKCRENENAEYEQVGNKNDLPISGKDEKYPEENNFENGPIREGEHSSSDEEYFEQSDDSGGGLELFDKEENPEPKNDKALADNDKEDKAMSDYFYMPQAARNAVWTRHRTVDTSNIVSGKRKRRQRGEEN